MKKLLLASLFAAATSSALAADVGVSISIGDPNFYGQIDIGNFPRPAVIYAEPVIIRRSPVVYEPIYLRVPPGHAKHWRQHCAEYRACGRPVYFVRDEWYNDVYAPRYRRHDYDRRDGRRDERRYPGNEHGHGHGKGKWQEDR
ncbi:hypothetical protein NH8B_2761 [Pseudogulbenkiania sp. NH8B]|uniref:Uncharacterized protein n=1 Tax=Pseudogulbenkiania ferrooxidans 2002 TaxID=279714 RepID=B9Z593_9NEIS|nr:MULTISPECIES: hypothetical protein [Pseudogulbenkiania]EEG08325.1 conserved hypothetical protein [Pseudogulbenkiania ferrooxidans 2002]BAK77554.1 hypothetical protein NH8B_2761 [Pseudogulbenkiania sp. NH8B]